MCPIKEKFCILVLRKMGCKSITYNENFESSLRIVRGSKSSVSKVATGNFWNTSFFGEKANHLGNVLNVVTDRKLPVADVNDPTKVAYFTGDVVSYSDYLAFGQVMPNRHGYTGAKYRFGFQKQEVDDELKGEGNSVNFEFRMHDPRIGRFLSLDPLVKKYPFYSPYSFSGNRVIDAVELEGAEPLKTNDKLNSDVYKPVFKINLPDGKRVIVYGTNGQDGRLAISGKDRDRINSFHAEGFSAGGNYGSNNAETYDLNSSPTKFYGIVGVDGCTPSSLTADNYSTFKVNIIQGPSVITRDILEDKHIDLKPMSIIDKETKEPVPVTPNNENVQIQILNNRLPGIDNELKKLTENNKVSDITVFTGYSNKITKDAEQAFKTGLEALKIKYPNVSLSSVSSEPISGESHVLDGTQIFYSEKVGEEKVNTVEPIK